MVQGSGFRGVVSGLRFSGFGGGIWGLGYRGWSSGRRVELRVESLGFRIFSLGLQGQWLVSGF